MEHVHCVSWSDSVLNYMLLDGLDDDLLVTLMLPDAGELSLVDFVNRVLQVMGSSFYVGEVDEESHDVSPVPSRGGWIAQAHLKPPPESSTSLIVPLKITSVLISTPSGSSKSSPIMAAHQSSLPGPPKPGPPAAYQFSLPATPKSPPVKPISLGATCRDSGPDHTSPPVLPRARKWVSNSADWEAKVADPYKDCHLDPLEQLCSIYQNGRPLEEYIHEFLTCSRQISLDRWTLLDCFWSGLDEEIAQQMPGAGSSWTLPDYINLARFVSRSRLLTVSPAASSLRPIHLKPTPPAADQSCLPAATDSIAAHAPVPASRKRMAMPAPQQCPPVPAPRLCPPVPAPRQHPLEPTPHICLPVPAPRKHNPICDPSPREFSSLVMARSAVPRESSSPATARSADPRESSSQTTARSADPRESSSQTTARSADRRESSSQTMARSADRRESSSQTTARSANPRESSSLVTARSADPRESSSLVMARSAVPRESSSQTTARSAVPRESSSQATARSADPSSRESSSLLSPGRTPDPYSNPPTSSLVSASSAPQERPQAPAPQERPQEHPREPVLQEGPQAPAPSEHPQAPAPSEHPQALTLLESHPVTKTGQRGSQIPRSQLQNQF